MKTKETKLIGVSLKEAPRQFRPYGDRILLERAKPEEVTAGGIILPVGADSSELINVSIVRAVGPEASLSIRLGTWVMHLPYATERVTINGQDFGICRIEDLLGELHE